MVTLWAKAAAASRSISADVCMVQGDLLGRGHPHAVSTVIPRGGRLPVHAAVFCDPSLHSREVGPTDR